MNDEKKIVPIVYALNNAFAMPTIVSITSLLVNSNSDTFFDIYLLVPSNFTEKDKFTDLKNMFSNFNITYIDMREAFNNAKISIYHLTKETYYRLLIPKVLPQYDKCIYLDGDTIIEQDILNLYEIDILDYYIAGVKNSGVHFDSRYDKHFCKEIGLPSLEQYIYAGLLLMNLKALRETKLEDVFINLANKNIEFPGNDQDVLNIFCYNHIKLLPLKFNSVTLRLQDPKWKLEKIYTDEEISEAINNPIIVHYAGDIAKPWKNTRCIFADNWWKYALISPYKNELLKLKEKLEIVYDLDKLLFKLKDIKNVIIFGFSEIGRELYNFLVREGLTNICCFCDNDIAKQNEKFVIPIISLDKAIKEYEEPFFLIASQIYGDEIEKQIMSRGVLEEQILKYYHKNYEFFTTENPVFYEKELEEKYWINTGYRCNLKNPQTFNEKLQWLKLYYKKQEQTQLADKYEVRKYIKEKIGQEYLIPLLGVYDNFDDIDFDKLPSEFVIKCSHDSGSVVICRDKTKLDIEQLKSKIDKRMELNCYYRSLEWPYKNIKPKIIIEKYMTDENSDSLTDYKFYCFDGEPKFLYISTGLEDHSTAKISFVTLEWEFAKFQRNDYKLFNKLPKKPIKFDEMIKIAKILSKGHKFIRVDLYQINGQIYFSELTFFPCSGYMPFNDSRYDKEIGKMLTI